VAPRKTTGGPAARKKAPAVPPEIANFYNTVPAAENIGDLDFTSDADEEIETEKLFSLDGVEYRIPVEFGPHLAMIFIDSAEEGELVAIARVLRDIIGPDGWRALTGFKGLKPEQLKAVLDRVMIKVMGTIEETLKNS
jgi:hypothetical protein